MSGLFGSPPQIFDFPCNERVRMMLRLECLGNRLHELLALPSTAAHEAWLGCHFELYDLLSTRSDVKNELLQELERQRQTLSRFEGKGPRVLRGVLFYMRIFQLFSELPDWENHYHQTKTTPPPPPEHTEV